jgi:glycosyltransferase involved in cell wall biosynthesis
MLRLSVLVPAYNEEATILDILRKVRAQSIPNVVLEVIVVDDGSSDRTVALLEAQPELYDRLVKQPSNGGKGAAVRAGLAWATGDYVLFQDADLEYDPADYRKLLEPVLRFDADVVVGSRMLASPWTRVHYFWHKQGNQFLTLMFNLLFNTTFTDTYTCYLLYRRSLLEPNELESNGWEQHAEILCRVVSRAGTCFEVAISYAGRTYAEGKKIRAHHALAVARMILKRRLALLWEDATLGRRAATPKKAPPPTLSVGPDGRTSTSRTSALLAKEPASPSSSE